jgi:hypothetical protein
LGNGKFSTKKLIERMEDPGYAYLQCDLLDEAALTTITLRVKLPYIKMHEQHL